MGREYDEKIIALRDQWRAVVGGADLNDADSMVKVLGRFGALLAAEYRRGMERAAYLADGYASDGGVIIADYDKGWTRAAACIAAKIREEARRG